MGTWAWGKAQVRRSSSQATACERRVALLAFGTLLQPALQVGEALDATVVNMRFAKPLDATLVLELARTHDLLVTVEEGCLMGGAGSAVSECLAAAGVVVPMLHLGLPDAFVEHGDSAGLLAQAGLDAAGIEKANRARLPHLTAGVQPQVVNA